MATHNFLPPPEKAGNTPCPVEQGGEKRPGQAGRFGLLTSFFTPQTASIARGKAINTVTGKHHRQKTNSE
jgi:hypothetical protein